MEKYICDQIHKFYTNNSIIYKNQYGFQAGKSTNGLLSQFTDKVNEYLNKKNIVLALFIDFTRAFDTLDHKQIINRLNSCGVGGPLLNWCKDYLNNRKYTVKIGDEQSKPITTTVGTAQGSVLGPLYFLTYVNDMNLCLSYSSCYQFADDTCLLVASKDPLHAFEQLQSDFNALIKWCHDAGLVINSNKTKLLIIKSPYLKYSNTKYIVAHNHTCLHNGCLLNCDCTAIEVADTQKYLGLVIDNKFNWNAHINHVCNKLR